MAKEDADKTALLTRAAQEFQTAIQLKGDYANAYYNLAKVLETAGNTQGAYAALQKAIAALDPASPDLSKATEELKTLESKLPKPSPSASPAPSGEQAQGDLSEPSPLPSPLDGGPIDLPEDSPLPSPTPNQ